MTLEERLEKHSLPEPNSGCRLWIGGLDPYGYGRIKVSGRNRGAHRVAYELKNGTLSSDLELDHVCRVKRCIELKHLEPVTPAVNMRRAVPFRSHSSSRLSAPRCGHGEYDVTYGTVKRCRTCLRASWRKANHKRIHHV